MLVCQSIRLKYTLLKQEQRAIENMMNLTWQFEQVYHQIDACSDAQDHVIQISGVNGFNYELVFDENHEMIEWMKEE